MASHGRNSRLCKKVTMLSRRHHPKAGRTSVESKISETRKEMLKLTVNWSIKNEKYLRKRRQSWRKIKSFRFFFVFQFYFLSYWWDENCFIGYKTLQDDNLVALLSFPGRDEKTTSQKWFAILGNSRVFTNVQGEIVTVYIWGVRPACWRWMGSDNMRLGKMEFRRLESGRFRFFIDVHWKWNNEEWLVKLNCLC